MEITAGTLQQMLKKLKPVAGESVRLECSEGKFRASVLNNDKSLEKETLRSAALTSYLWMEVATEVATNFADEIPPLFFPYKDLAQLFAGADKSATIEFSDKAIKYNGISYRLNASVEFAVAKPSKSSVGLNISGLKNVMPFVSAEINREICGVNAKSDGRLFFTGTDGRILKKVDMGLSRSMFDVIIPYEASKLLCCSKSDDIRFGRSKARLSFEYDDITIVTAYPSVPYPDVDEVFSTVKDDITVTVNRAELMEKVFDVAKVLTLQNKFPDVGVLFFAVDTTLELSAKYKHGIATTTIDAEIKGTGKFMLSPNRLHTVLDSIDTDQVTFKLSNWDGKVSVSGPIPPVGVVGADNEQIAIMQMAFVDNEGSYDG